MRALIWGGGFLAALSFGWLWFEWTCYLGRGELSKIATAHNLCRDGDCVNTAAAIVEASTGASRTTIEWCLGVENISQTKVHRGGWLKAILVDVMYYPCEGAFEKK